MIKKYTKFLEEVTIKGNSGIPNDDYLSDSERRARARLGSNGNPLPEADFRLISQNGMELMRLLHISSSLIVGKERELEKLAKKAILSNYGSILDGVELDIRLVKRGEPKDLMEPGEMPVFRITNDPELRKEVDKAKLLNNIIQGEAKNTKSLLHTEEVKEGINGIFGKELGEFIFDTWDKMTKIADKMDWMVPVSAKSDMMEDDPNGLAGAVKVEWKGSDDKKDLSDKVLKSLENDGDIKDNEDDISELFSYGPKITAVGLDFPMLLHETVKGIYELIAAHSIPDDPEFANKIKSNVSSFADEAEDFRYGPEIASDLRDFVNSVIDSMSKTNSSIWEIDNLREFVFGKMVDRKYLTTDDFLKLFKGILSNTDEAKSKLKLIIGDVLKELGDVQTFNMDDLGLESPSEDEDDYSKLSKREIEKMIDDSLDDGNFTKVKELTEILNKYFPEK